MFDFSDNRNAERQQIRSALQPHLTPEHHFSVGGLIVGPNRAGCFWRHGKWFVYRTDEHAFCMINGPFSVEGAIHVSLQTLHVKTTGYPLSDEERTILFENHFRSLAEIDEYMK